MALPTLNNQTPTGMTFKQLAEYSDAKPIFRLKLKRRYVSGGVDAYDADWTTITSYVLEDGLGEVIYGVDDQQWIQGVTRIGTLDLELDNTERRFNDRTDEDSLWYDASTDYYIANSLIELEFGFELPTETQVYSDRPFHSGLLKQDSVMYNILKNTINFSVMSKLDWLQTVNIYDAYSYTNIVKASAMGMVDVIYEYIADNAPTALELSGIANFPRTEVFYDSIEEVNDNAYAFIESIARQTGSLFGINRAGGVYLSYYNCPYYQNTNTSFVSDSDTVAFYNFDEAVTNTAVIDSKGSYDMGTGHTTGAISRLGTGKFGSSRVYETPDRTTVNTFASFSYSITYMSATAGDYSLDVLFRFNRRSTVLATWDDFIQMNDQGDSGSTDGDHFVSIGQDNNGKVMTLVRPYVANFWVPLYKHEFNLGTGQWCYFSAVNDTVANERRYYINGTNVYSIATSTSFTLATLVFGSYRNGSADIEFDTARVSNIARTETQIKNDAARIFSNKLEWASTSAYDFYTYGAHQNIESIIEYDEGFSKIYNKVIIKNEQTHIYKSSFYYAPATLSYILLQLGPRLYRNFSITSPTYTTVLNATSTAIKDWLEGQENTVQVTLTATDTYDVFITTNDKESMETAGISFLEYFDGLFYGDLSIPADYIGAYKTARFNRYDKQSDYVYANTASIQEYGVRQYNLEEIDNLTSALSQTAAIAESILDNYAQPKVRMRVRARYLAGDLDLFDRVTFHYQADAQDAALHWDDNLDGWNEDCWGVEAGRIRWTEKDFWVISVNHSFKENHSLYTLREV